MDFKVKSSIAVDVATHVFNFYLPLIPTIEKSKNQDIVGALGYMLKVTVWPLDELEIR